VLGVFLPLRLGVGRPVSPLLRLFCWEEVRRISQVPREPFSAFAPSPRLALTSKANCEVRWALAPVKDHPHSNPDNPSLIVLQDGEGNGSVNLRDKQGLQIRVRVREAVGIAGLMNDLGIDVPPVVPEGFVRRKLRAIVGAFCGKITFIDTDTEISEERVRVDGRRVPPVIIRPVLRQ
jgi:hypothetical protein